MGACTSTAGHYKSPHKETLKCITSGVLKFNIELSNIKLKYNVKSCYLKINIADVYTINTPVHIDLNGQHQWIKKMQTKIEASELQLKSLYLTIALFETNQQLALLNYMILQLDLLILITNSQRGEFPLKSLCHKLQTWKYQSIHLIAYAYSLRLITQKLNFVTENSEKFLNPAYKKGLSASFENVVNAMHNMSWLNQSSPKLLIEIPLNELYFSSLQICIWSINKIVNEDVSPLRSVKSLSYRSEVNEQLLFGEAYLGLSNLLAGDGQKDPFFDQYMPTVEKGLWSRGKRIGNLKVELRVKMPIYLNQQLVGIRTEKGCAIGHSLLVNSSVKEINEIVNQYDRLSRSIFKIQDRRLDIAIKAQIYIDAQVQAEQLLDALSKSHKEGQNIQFYYKCYDDLFKAQEIFITIAEHLIMYVDKLEENLKDRYFHILHVVSNRGEFNLTQMGYFDACKSLTKKQLEYKNKICLNYQHFLTSSLNFILKRITQIKTMSIPEKEFIELFLVRAFFRIPEFRQQFLQSIVHSNDPTLYEWRGSLYGLDESNDQLNDQISSLFDWQSYFYNYLSIPQNHSEIHLLQDDEWKIEFSKRNLPFCLFISEYCIYISRFFQKEFIPWHLIPGYRTLLKAFLCEMKQRTYYNEVFIDTILSVAQNTTLLNAIIMILFKKCNLYNAELVVNTLEIIDKCFKQCIAMPTNFDYPFLLNGIKIVVFESQHSLSVATCLNLLYNNFVKFPIEFRKALAEVLLSEQAFSLFLHWSKMVRTVFQSFILYRLYHLHRNVKIQIMDEEQFDIQYTQMCKPKRLQSFYENRKEEKQLISDYIYLKYTRFLMTIEQAKQKMKEIELIKDIPLIQRMKMKLSKLQKNQRLSIRELVIHDDSHQLLNKVNDEKKLELFEKKNEFRNPVRKQTIILLKDQFRYLLTASAEYNDLMKVYTKWRQQNIATSQIQGNSPEEKSQQYLEFPVPPIKVMQHLDLKEGN